MVYLATKTAPFVYGDFVFAGKVTGKGVARSLPPLSGMHPFAIEILREYSASEFIGKLYIRQGSTWQPAAQHDLNAYPWYQMFQKAKDPKAKKALAFRMEGSGVWSVDHFREESDQTGLYMAVALKFQSS